MEKTENKKKSTRGMSVAREVAFDSYIAVMEQGRKPEDILEEKYRARSVSKPDRALAMEILYGSLRWHSKIYWILQHTSSRPLTEVSAEVRAALVCGTYQIFYLDRIPDRAAVNESAEYVRIKSQAAAVPFVNGILRQIARRAEYFTKPDKKTRPVEYLSLQFAAPEWLVARWLKRFRFEKMEEMLASLNEPPPLFIRVNSLKTPLTEIHAFQQQFLREEHIQSNRASLKGCLSLKKFPDLGDETLFAKGFYTIQDQASQIIALLVDPKPQDTILDAAAGPGGKFSHIYELSQGEAQLIAVEKDERQLERAKQTFTRLQFDASRVTWAHADFLAYKPPTVPTKILLDAPCSGLGVIRRHPEAKWQKHEEAISRLATQQRQMILQALKVLQPGGELIYSVCSFEPEESLDHLNWLKKEMGPYVEEISLLPRLPDYFKRYVTRENILMIFAGNQDNMDGFAAFAVRLKSPLP